MFLARFRRDLGGSARNMPMLPCRQQSDERGPVGRALSCKSISDIIIISPRALEPGLTRSGACSHVDLLWCQWKRAESCALSVSNHGFPRTMTCMKHSARALFCMIMQLYMVSGGYADPASHAHHVFVLATK